ncbi:hypothetical protein BDR03DRAFT_1014963 [Suillus americanus]|nr:hypothetical protein BDR03DRAFT_1014963 [Suillus americanus]
MKVPDIDIDDSGYEPAIDSSAHDVSNAVDCTEDAIYEHEPAIDHSPDHDVHQADFDHLEYTALVDTGHDDTNEQHGGKPKQVHRNTYFAHKPARTARLFPPPPPAELVAAVPSCSKRSLDMCDDNEQEPAPRKKGCQRDIHSDLPGPDNHILHDSDNNNIRKTSSSFSVLSLLKVP